MMYSESSSPAPPPAHPRVLTQTAHGTLSVAASAPCAASPRVVQPQEACDHPRIFQRVVVCIVVRIHLIGVGGRRAVGVEVEGRGHAVRSLLGAVELGERDT